MRAAVRNGVCRHCCALQTGWAQGILGLHAEASRKAQTDGLVPLSSSGPGGRAPWWPGASVWCCAGASRHNHVAGDNGPLCLLCAAPPPWA